MDYCYTRRYVLMDLPLWVVVVVVVQDNPVSACPESAVRHNVREFRSMFIHMKCTYKSSEHFTLNPVIRTIW
jgi:hypothetical protein